MNVFILLTASGILSMLAGVQKRKSWGLPIVLAACASAIIMITFKWYGDYDAVMHNMQVFDTLSGSFSRIMIFLTIGIFILSYYYYPAGVEHKSDIYALFVFSLSGAFLLVSFNNLVMLFLGAEIMSIPLYILAASHRRNLLSNEAGLKYYLMGSFATCFLLLGITLVYGATGTFDVTETKEFIQNGGLSNPFIVVGFTLIFSTLLFKLSAAPFHFWAPDVYEGAPTVLTAFVSTVVKIAVVAAMIRMIEVLLLSEAGAAVTVPVLNGIQDTPWFWLLALSSAASMLFGSIVALQQIELKRFLAYTGIFNAGFILIPVLMHDTQTHKTLLYYLLGYGIASILSFTIYAELKKDTGQASISGLQGLLYKNKIAGTSLLICLLSFTGIPPLAGFWGKFGILSGGLEGHLLPLVICAILASIIGAYNYVRIIFLIATPDQKNTQSIHLRPFFSSWILLGTVLLVVLGLIPDLFLSKI